MVKLTDKQVREALDRFYDEESSELDEELLTMQSASVPEEDWECVEKDDLGESDE